MNKSVMKNLAILICVLLLASAIAACSNKADNSGGNAAGDSTSSAGSTGGAENKPAQPANAGDEKPEPAKLKVFNRVNADIVLDDNPVIAEVEKLANVELSIEAPPINNYVDKLQIVMASGDLPDLIYNWGGADSNYETWAANGLLEPLDDKIAQYPNLTKNISQELWDAVKSVADGKTYIIPRTNIVNNWGYMINQQWLDKLKLKAPATLEEFTEVCKAFTQQDPDGNGQADTYCVTMSNPELGSNTIWNSTNFLTSAFNLPFMPYKVGGAPDVDGVYKIKEKMSGYIPYLQYVKMLHDEKLIDPEFLINKINTDIDKMNQNRIGIRYAHQYAVMGNIRQDPESDVKYTYHAPLKDANGVATSWVTPSMWGGWMIPKGSKNVDAALKLLDWGNTTEANTLLQLGLPGLTYDSYDPATKSISRTPEQATKLASTTSTYMTFANAINGTGAIIEGADTAERMAKFNAQLDEAMKQTTVVQAPAVRAQKILNLNNTIPDLVKKKDDQEMRFILGNITLEQFKSFLEKEWFPATADAEKEYVDYMNSVSK